MCLVLLGVLCSSTRTSSERVSIQLTFLDLFLYRSNPSVLSCTANGFAAGWGNAGAGVAYFAMPAVYDGLRGMNHSSHVAWRISFIVPTILLLFCAGGSFFLCPDTPTGSWADRFNHNANSTSTIERSDSEGGSIERDNKVGYSDKEKTDVTVTVQAMEHGESNIAPSEPALKVEDIPKPSLKDSLRAICCLQTLMLAVPYACSFGGELAVNSILGPWYLQKFPTWGQTKSGQVAAAFGLFNVVSRPLGGVIADWIYAWVPARWGTKGKQCWYGGVSQMLIW